jgi:hypothetical protein
MQLCANDGDVAAAREQMRLLPRFEQTAPISDSQPDEMV